MIGRSDAGQSVHRQRAIWEEILRSLREQLPGSREELPSGGWLVYVLGEGKLRTHICVSRNAAILLSVSKRLSPASSEAAGEKKALIGSTYFFFFPPRCPTLAL